MARTPGFLTPAMLLPSAHTHTHTRADARTLATPARAVHRYANTVGYERGLAAVQRFAQGPALDAPESGVGAAAAAAVGAPAKAQAAQDLWCLLSGALPAGG